MNLLKSGIIVTLLTLFSRIFGFAREVSFASIFGTNQIADCVNIAFKFPNLFRRILGEGALSTVFIPIYSKKLVASQKEAHKFSSEIFIMLTLMLICLTCILQILMPFLIILIAPGFLYNNEKYNLTITLCRITLPYVIFISITALFGGMLNSIRKFFAFAFVPIIMNICVLSILYLTKEIIKPHYSISYSLIISGIMQTIFMYFCLHKAGLKFSIALNFTDPDVKILIQRMGPATLSAGAQQINLFIAQSIASFLPRAISILSYADRLYQLPLSLVGVTFSTILLPELSKLYKNHNYIEANLLQNKAIKIAIIISIPTMFGLLTLSQMIVNLIYERGAFSLNDTQLTANALSILSFGLPAFTLVKILNPIFYANLDTKTPAKISLHSIIINIILNIVLAFNYSHLGIAMGSSITAWINFWLLKQHAKKIANFTISHDTKTLSVKVIICSLIMYLVILILLKYFVQLYYLTSILITKIIILFGIITVAIIVFTISAYLFNIHKILFIEKY